MDAALLQQLVADTQKVVANTQHQREWLITLTSAPGNRTDIIDAEFPAPIWPGKGRSLELALTGFRTYFSWPNIYCAGTPGRAANNTLEYSLNGEEKTITLPEGSYEIEAINGEIQRQLAANGDWDETNQTHFFSVSPNLATLKAVIEVTDPEFKVDIGASLLRTVLGWPATAAVLCQGRHEAPNIAQISDVNEILVNCDVVNGGYTSTGDSVTAELGYTLFSFSPEVPPGYKVSVTPRPRVFLPVYRDQIQSLRIWVTDQNKRPLNLRGEPVTVTCVVRDRPAN